ncbi:MAG: carbohydrate kinase [Bacteroidales bacterium]|nr:carbohydrate kinase [Bacteroidales bacterium]
MKRPVIIGLGEIVWDCQDEAKTLGGAPVNFAYHAQQLGADSYPISAVGKDTLGKETLEACRSFGLRTEFLQQNDFPTSRVLVSLAEDGVPTYRILENVAWDSLQATPELFELASRADAVCWGSLAQRSEASRSSILSILDHVPVRAMRVFDINLRQKYYSKSVIEYSLERANVLKLNEDELPIVMELLSLDGIHDIISRYSLDYLIYTCGAKDSEVYGPCGLLSHLDTPSVKVVDTVGAGDSFTAAFIASILRGESVAAAHAKAVKVSAMVCESRGAIVPLKLD